MNFREAMLYARSGKTVTRAGKIVRHLTREEGDAHQLTYNPSRRTKLDADGKTLIENGQIAVEEYGDVGPRPHRLGLFDVSQTDENGHALSFRPTDEDIYVIDVDEAGAETSRALRTDWKIVEEQPIVEEKAADPAPDVEAAPPEAVDEALAETEHPQ
jgi:hypothetical protein